MILLMGYFGGRKIVAMKYGSCMVRRMATIKMATLFPRRVYQRLLEVAPMQTVCRLW